MVRQMDRQMDGQTDGQTDRQTDIHTDGQTEGQTDRQTDRLKGWFYQVDFNTNLVVQSNDEMISFWVQQTAPCSDSHLIGKYKFDQ